MLETRLYIEVEQTELAVGTVTHILRTASSARFTSRDSKKDSADPQLHLPTQEMAAWAEVEADAAAIVEMEFSQCHFGIFQSMPRKGTAMLVAIQAQG
jgi:hypothetical protein